MNPWGVTERQAEMLDALITHKCMKRAADSVGVSIDSASQLVGRAKRSMGAVGMYEHLILWDRYRNKTLTGTESRVCADIAARQAKGICKYGTTVEANPLPALEWARHAYEEALDMAVYLRRLVEELERRNA